MRRPGASCPPISCWKTHLTQRYGAKFLPEDIIIQGLGASPTTELEPHYDTFEHLCGNAGDCREPAKGQKQPFGNLVGGTAVASLSRTLAQKQPYGAGAWAEAASWGRGTAHSPQPSGNLLPGLHQPTRRHSRASARTAASANGSVAATTLKASPQTMILPLLMRRTNFEARTECEVTRINLDSTGKRATGVTYVDTAAREWEQPAEMVFLCAFQMFNVQLLLLSGIGQPYDPNTGQGVIGRNYSYQVTSSVEAFFDNKIFNTFISGGAVGMCIDEFNGDNFDSLAALLRRRRVYGNAAATNARLIETTKPTPLMHAALGCGVEEGGRQGQRSQHDTAGNARQLLQLPRLLLDLDPTYKRSVRSSADADDLRLPRKRTPDVYTLTDCLSGNRPAHGASTYRQAAEHRPFRHCAASATHTCGGAIAGTDSKTSALNRYLQSWDVHKSRS